MRSFLDFEVNSISDFQNPKYTDSEFRRPPELRNPHISNSDIPDPVVNICRLTGGEIFEPGDPSGLKSVFQRIDEMQETRMEKISSETMDNFEPYSLAGLSVLALSLICLMGFRYTPW